MREKLVYSCFIGLLVVFAGSIGNWTFSQEKPEDFAESNGPTILEGIFPFERPEKILQPGSNWTCIIRVIRPHDSGVDHLILRRTIEGDTQLTYRYSLKGIYSQIFGIKKRNPNATIDTVQKQMVYASYLVQYPDCLEKVKRYADYLKDLRAPILPHEVLAIHAAKYQLKCKRYDNWFSFSWPSGYEPGEPGSEFKQWVDSLLEIAKKDPQYDALLGKSPLFGTENKPVEK